HLTGASGRVAVLAVPEADDGAPGLRLATGYLLHERGQRLGIPSPHGRAAVCDEPRDIHTGGLHCAALDAFAVAFIAFLCSRTLASDSGETMSATLRYAPSSP